MPMSKVNICDHCGAVDDNIYVPTHWSVSLPATTKEIHLCTKCEELFRRWIGDFLGGDFSD